MNNFSVPFSEGQTGIAQSDSLAQGNLRVVSNNLDASFIPKDNYFKARPFTKVIEDGNLEPERRSICGAFVYENTITYFFSRTNYGKSIFAFQVAYAAATGTAVAGCEAMRNECDPMKVLLFDLENDAKIIHDRHKRAFERNHPLQDNLVFMHEKPGNMIAVSYDLLDKIEHCAVEYQAKLVIIDNISRLLPDSLKPDTVTLIIARLQQIRERTGAALLVIGHTTKGDPRTAVSPVSYYGSAMLQNFFTEMFFLDTTRDGRFFLCHAKTKQKECRNVTVPVFTRDDNHPEVGLGFTYERFQNLADIQLPMMLEQPKSQRSRNLAEYWDCVDALLKAGKTHRRIAGFAGAAPSSITYLINHHE